MLSKETSLLDLNVGNVFYIDCMFDRALIFAQFCQSYTYNYASTFENGPNIHFHISAPV